MLKQQVVNIYLISEIEKNKNSGPLSGVIVHFFNYLSYLRLITRASHHFCDKVFRKTQHFCYSLPVLLHDNDTCFLKKVPEGKI